MTELQISQELKDAYDSIEALKKKNAELEAENARLKAQRPEVKQEAEMTRTSCL